MAQVTIEGPSDPRHGPATNEETPERGWSFKRIVEAMNTMYEEIYAAAGLATTAATAELNLLDGATSANDVASIVPVLDDAKMLRTPVNVGVPGSGVTAVEYGDGYKRTTVLTVDTVLPAIAGGAALGVGALLYTLPAGNAVIDSARMDLAITQSEGNINADTPVVGLGSVIASGVVSDLNGTAAFEDIVTGQAAADCDGTATNKAALPSGGTPFLMEDADAHTVHFNAAATWAAGGDAAAQVTGTVVINWHFLG